MNRFSFRESAALACPHHDVGVTGENPGGLAIAVAGFTEHFPRGVGRRAVDRRFEFANRATGQGSVRAGRFSARWIWAGAAMAPAEEYRRKAEALRKQAASVTDGALRQAYLEVADEYDRLAMEVEKAERGNGNG
jgi:hypothetical protein